MKTKMMIVALAVTLFSCSKKEDPKPDFDPNEWSDIDHIFTDDFLPGDTIPTDNTKHRKIVLLKTDSVNVVRNTAKHFN